MGSVHKDPNVFHFSHPHPLECTTAPSTGTVSCFGCKLKVKCGEDYYQCKTCAFSLHCVCYKMPLVTNHPSHPRHDLVLLVIPSTKATLNCVACGHHVTSFCYHCAECSIFFHSLCLALPVSLPITYHPHEIKLEFSPPYDFFCDLCNKPSYNGWLYRCSMCEFDTHIACAVENLEPHLFQNPTFPQSSPLLRQLTSHQVEHKRLNASVYKGHDLEIISLVAQQIGGGIRENFDSAVAGWDKRLYSCPRQNNTGSGRMKIVELELQEKELSPAEFLSKLEERAPLRDQSTPLSDHSSTPLSNQYSDSYFSIDLAKSYSTHGRSRSQVRREGESDQITRAVMAERVVSNSGRREEPFDIVNWPCNDSYDVAQQSKVNAAFFIKEGRTSHFGKSSQRVMMKNPNESFAKQSVKDQTVAKSESERSSCSGWRKFLTCCP
ncbi:protein-disulfide reductase [Spatholobus suberectus]|nr:protein-disulfide reductase [Spatholobus suberectus]